MLALVRGASVNTARLAMRIVTGIALVVVDAIAVHGNWGFSSPRDCELLLNCTLCMCTGCSPVVSSINVALPKPVESYSIAKTLPLVGSKRMPEEPWPSTLSRLKLVAGVHVGAPLLRTMTPKAVPLYPKKRPLLAVPPPTICVVPATPAVKEQANMSFSVVPAAHLQKRLVLRLADELIAVALCTEPDFDR
jgi:hypothetical protein